MASKATAGSCLVQKTQRKVTCLQSFPAACGSIGCECEEEPCEHMDVDHPPFTPLLERWVDLLEPVELKRQRATEKTRASLLKEISSVTPIMLERDLTGERSLTPTFNVSELTAGQRLYARLLKYTPEAARQIPVRQNRSAPQHR